MCAKRLLARNSENRILNMPQNKDKTMTSSTASNYISLTKFRLKERKVINCET